MASEDLDKILDKTQDNNTGLNGPPPAPDKTQIADNIELAKLSQRRRGVGTLKAPTPPPSSSKPVSFKLYIKSFMDKEQGDQIFNESIQTHTIG